MISDETVVASGSVLLQWLINKALFIKKDRIRHDIVVRYMGIESYVATGTVHPLYPKMEQMRVEMMSKDSNARYVPDRFPVTIESFKETRAYDPKSPIILGSNFLIVEGAHRLACCMYFNIEQIQFVIWKKEVGIIDDRPWFKANFTEEEFALIETKKEELYNRFVSSELEL